MNNYVLDSALTQISFGAIDVDEIKVELALN